MKPYLLIILLGLLPLWAQAAATKQPKTTIIGVSKPLKANIEKRLKLIEDRSRKDYSHHAKSEIKLALQPFGYFRPHIIQKGHTFHIQPGPALHWRKVDIRVVGDGSQDAEFQKMIATSSLKAHEQFSSENYESLKDELYSLAAERGYFDARTVKSHIRINLKAYYADVTLIFQTGPRYKFGQLHFSKTPLDNDFLKRYASFSANDYYNNKELLQFQDNLINSHYFTNVNVLANPQKAHHYVIPVNIGLKARKRRRYIAGAGYGTDTGPRVLGGFEMRYLNAYGHHFKAYYQGSQLESSGIFDYIIPGPNPVTDEHRFSANVKREFQTRPSFNSSKRNRERIGNEISQSFSYTFTTVNYGWKQIAGITFLSASFFNTGQEDRNSHFLMPHIAWIKRDANDILSPTKGYKISILMRGAVDDVASSDGFFQIRGDAKALYPLNEKQILVVRGAVGYTEINNIFNLPITMQFLEGGERSIRGYSFQTIGPNKALLIGSAEFRHKIKGNWYAAVYYDAGNVSRTFQGKYFRSVGTGLVWRSPIGTIAASVAKPLDLARERYRFVFTMGAEL